MLTQPVGLDSPFSAVDVTVERGHQRRGDTMSELAWVLTEAIIAVAIVGAICNTLLRNTIAAIALSIACSFTLW
jgi:hypothetical protein